MLWICYTWVVATITALGALAHIISCKRVLTFRNQALCTDQILGILYRSVLEVCQCLVLLLVAVRVALWTKQLVLVLSAHERTDQPLSAESARCPLDLDKLTILDDLVNSIAGRAVDALWLLADELRELVALAALDEGFACVLERDKFRLE